MSKLSCSTRQFTRRSAVTLMFLATCFLGFNEAQAAKTKPPKVNTINLIPTITSVDLVNGNLVASGFITATIKSVTTTVPFTAPVTFDGTCPILDLQLGPIDLTLLGLEVETSQICLAITADPSGGVLGNLLCGVAGLLDGGLSLNDVLGAIDPLTGTTVGGLTAGQVNDFLGALTDLLNGALGKLSGAILTAINPPQQNNTCAILHLELGPVTLNLLGLIVDLDNCENGPVTVDITGHTGPGKLLGNLLCELLDGNLINLGATLQNIVNQILGLLTT